MSAACPLTLKLPCAIWLPLDGIFAHYQQDVSRQSVPTDLLSVQYLYCTDSVKSVLTDSSRQRQRVVVPSPSFSQAGLFSQTEKGKRYFGHRRYLLAGEAERLDPKDATHREHPPDK